MMLKNLHQHNDNFKPLFDHTPDAILSGLCREFDDSFSYGIQPSALCIDAIRLVHPKTEIIASLMRAIKNRFVLSCQYVSLSSGHSSREIVPHAIVNNGHRWHTRAFDRQSQQFRDFVCSRFEHLEVLIEPAAVNERREADQQWNTIVNLDLIPHPKLKHQRAIEMEYQMHKGKLNLDLRASLTGYLLHQWQVDCSVNHQLNCNQYQLALHNPQALTQVDNLVLAPGFH